ncbi:MAG: nitrate/nitrite transporter NrtS [Thermoleophilaceae bacterium]|jgi:RNase P/RNase MRP subunit POP5
MRSALRFCARREHLRRTVVIAALVGTLLTAINLGDVIVDGRTTSGTLVKAVLNYLVPFVVSNLGLLSARR